MSKSDAIPSVMPPGLAVAQPKDVVQAEPVAGGSYVRNPDAGTITRTQPAPADQPVQE